MYGKHVFHMRTKVWKTLKPYEDHSMKKIVHHTVTILLPVHDLHGFIFVRLFYD